MFHKTCIALMYSFSPSSSRRFFPPVVYVQPRPKCAYLHSALDEDSRISEMPPLQASAADMFKGKGRLQSDTDEQLFFHVAFRNRVKVCFHLSPLRSSIVTRRDRWHPLATIFHCTSGSTGVNNFLCHVVIVFVVTTLSKSSTAVGG